MPLRIVVIFLAGLLLGVVCIVSRKFKVIGKVLINLCLAEVFLFGTFFAALMLAFSKTDANVYSVFLLVVAGTLLIFASCLLWGIGRKKRIYIPTVCILVATAVSLGGYQIYKEYINKIPTMGEGEAEQLLLEYTPYGAESKVVVLEEEASLQFYKDIPSLDGATALFPVYSAFARAVFSPESLQEYGNAEINIKQIKQNPYLKCTTIAQAYENIIKGSADMIFVAAPSKEQEQAARDQGVELVFTPIGKEAFIFFVNAKNPVNDLAMEQIRQIYSGEVTHWKELGVKGVGEIRPFQREEGSGSQSALQRLMEGKNLANPPTEDRIGGMGGIIRQTADYKNYKNAIGFSFRFYSTEMVKNNQIKLLSVNGVFPNTQNIENGTYPIASDFYAVTRGDATENTKQLLEWILGEQGQKIIAQTGYTPISG